MDKIKYVGMGTPEYTPVEAGSMPGRASFVNESGSLNALA